MVPIARPDYHMEWDGSADGGRGLDNNAFDPAGYPGLADTIRPSSYFPLLTMTERDELNGRAADPELLARRTATGVRTMGGALVGSLLASALDRGVHIAAPAPVEDLERSGRRWTVTLGRRRSAADRAGDRCRSGLWRLRMEPAAAPGVPSLPRDAHQCAVQRGRRAGTRAQGRGRGGGHDRHLGRAGDLHAGPPVRRAATPAGWATWR